MHREHSPSYQHLVLERWWDLIEDGTLDPDWAASLVCRAEDAHARMIGPDADRRDEAGNRLIGARAGHGFKFASVIGEILADLTIDGQTAHPIGFLDPARNTRDA